MNLFKTLLCAVAVWLSSSIAVEASLILDLEYELDGNSIGTTSFGTVEFTQSGNDVDISIVANTLNLNGGDIHEFYFSLPFAPTNLSVLNSGGVSNRPIGDFSIIGPNPSVAGGAGSSFEWGVNFGNGAGPPGNGLLTTADFTLHADQSLLISDFVAEFTDPNNTPPIHVAVHFQSTDIFGANSETVGADPPVVATPEPASLAIWLGLGCCGVAVTHFRRRRQPTTVKVAS